MVEEIGEWFGGGDVAGAVLLVGTGMVAATVVMWLLDRLVFERKRDEYRKKIGLFDCATALQPLATDAGRVAAEGKAVTVRVAGMLEIIGDKLLDGDAWRRMEGREEAGGAIRKRQQG